jgi:protein-tyrosine kinase
MNAAPPGRHRPDSKEAEVIAAVIDRCQLADSEIESITATARASNMSFVDAAVHAGLITSEDVIEATTSVSKSRTMQGTSIIEQVLHRRRGAQSLTVRHPQVVRPGPQLQLAHRPDTERSERLRALRTELLLLTENHGHSSLIAVMSPGSGEGRSQLAAELAIAFSQLGRRTLLVDGDLRKPRQHQLFDAPNDWGLAQALAHQEAPTLFSVEGLPFLTLIPSGALPPNPLELLSGGRLGALLSTWRHNYDFVIIDTPPVSLYSDGLAVATTAGLALLVGQLASTSHSQMKDMIRRLAMTQARILGAVTNQF